MKRSIIKYVLALALAASFNGAGQAFAQETNPAPGTNAVAQTKGFLPHDFVDGFMNLEFSNYHFTPRGLNLQDKGLVSQPYARLDWNFYKPAVTTNRFVEGVSVTTAVWNDVDTVRSGVDPGNWNEVDFFVGPNVAFGNGWTFESPFIDFKSETGSFPACWAWDPRLTYHDHFLGNFSFNPYMEFFDELHNKISIVLVPARAQSSYYGVVGLDPTYTFTKYPVKLELPTYLLVPAKNYYQREDGSGGGTDVALVSTMLKVTVPLEFLSTGDLKWCVYAGVQYDYLHNHGLLDGNQIDGAAQNRQNNFVVFHGGLNVRF